MEDLEYITKDALIMCDKGGAPDYFRPTLNQTVKIHGCLVATQIDFIPLINIPSFKICTITQKPCMPFTTPWQETWPVKVWHQRTLLGRCYSQCALGGRVEFLTSGQIPLPEDAKAEVRTLQEQCKKELDDAGYGDSVGECGFWESLIPVWGSGKDMINDFQTGDYLWGVYNGFFCVWDVCSVIAGVASFGGGTALMQGIKAGITQGVKSGVRALSTKAMVHIGRKGFQKLTKELLKKSIDDVSRKLFKVCVFACFPAGTPVHTATGMRAIETILPGDLVWSFNEETGEIALKEVLQTVEREIDVTVKLTIGQETIETTAEHPFYTSDGWKDAAELETGELIRRKDDDEAPVLSVDFDYTIKKVFNFEVADWHTYFVGVFAWLVHNNKARCLSELIIELTKFSSRIFRVGNFQILLDKKGLKHILSRHHLKYWDGSVKELQTFLSKNMSVSDIEKGIREVIKQNRDAIIKNGTRRGQYKGVVDGVERTIGFKNGRVGQFY